MQDKGGISMELKMRSNTAVQSNFIESRAFTRLKEVATSHHRWKHLVLRIFIYVTLANFAFVFLLPFIYMISTSLKSSVDLVDPYVNWIPVRGIEWKNYLASIKALDYWRTLGNSLFLSTVCTLGHVLSCSFAAYAFARISFPGKGFLFILVILTIIVPAQVIIIPLYIINNRLGLNTLLGGYLPLMLPTFMGMGLRGGLFIFIYRQLFMGIPNELEEAAYIDGCNIFRTYWNIVMPIAKAATLVTSILSIVWHWNDYYEPGFYILSLKRTLLPMMLPKMQMVIDRGGEEEIIEMFNIAVRMGAVFLAILPMLIMYFFLQKRFMEGIERSGLVG